MRHEKLFIMSCILQLLIIHKMKWAAEKFRNCLTFLKELFCALFGVWQLPMCVTVYHGHLLVLTVLTIVFFSVNCCDFRLVIYIWITIAFLLLFYIPMCLLSLNFNLKRYYCFCLNKVRVKITHDFTRRKLVCHLLAKPLIIIIPPKKWDMTENDD